MRVPITMTYKRVREGGEERLVPKAAEYAEIPEDVLVDLAAWCIVMEEPDPDKRRLLAEAYECARADGAFERI